MSKYRHILICQIESAFNLRCFVRKFVKIQRFKVKRPQYYVVQLVQNLRKNLLIKAL